MTAKKKSKDPKVADAPPDPREPLAPTPANLQASLAELKAVLAVLPVPSVSRGPVAEGPVAEGPVADGQKADGGEPRPQLDLVEAMLHIYFADGLPCGYGQEARRRIGESFVDRNEFRVTEAFEVEDLLRDLAIPNLFDRCLAVRDSVAQIYNDQNGVNLAFLREAGISDRNTFFQRIQAMQPHVAAFLANLLTVEELCFSDKSTLRAQQRLGIDAKEPAVGKWLDEVRAILAPYGHLPLDVGPHLVGGKPNLKFPLSPACLLVRLAPAGKRRS